MFASVYSVPSIIMRLCSYWSFSQPTLTHTHTHIHTHIHTNTHTHKHTLDLCVACVGAGAAAHPIKQAWEGGVYRDLTR